MFFIEIETKVYKILKSNQINLVFVWSFQILAY